MGDEFLNSRRKIADFRERLSSIGTTQFVEVMNGDTDLFSKDEIEFFNEIFSNFNACLSWFMNHSPTAKFGIVKLIADALALDKEQMLQLRNYGYEIERVKIASEE